MAASDCGPDKRNTFLFENISSFDFNQDERSSGELRVPADMDAFIDAEFGKIYEGEEMYRDVFDGERGTEASYSGSQSTLLQQVELLDKTRASVTSPDSVFGNIGDYDQGAERSQEVCFEEKHDNQVVCCQCSNLQKSASCFLDAVGRGKDAFKRKTVFDRDKDSLMACPNPEDSLVTEEYISHIREDVGTCYKSLAPKLGIGASKIHNIDEDYKWNADKAHAMLLKWRQEKGSCATVMVLVKALRDIGRRDIADKLCPGFSGANMPSEELGLELQIKCQLTVNSRTANQVMLCEDKKGKKYIVKELAGAEWNAEEILREENTLSRALSAVEGVKKSKEHKCQESLKRIRAELDKLQERLKKYRVEDKDEQFVPIDAKQTWSEEKNPQQHKVKEQEELLKSCEFQCKCWQGMYNGLIKLTGEVGALEENNQVVRQLTDFTKELRQQEKGFFPRINQLEEQREDLNETQLGRLAKLKCWQKTQSQQVEGIEKLLTCLLEQRPNYAKAMNRKSEPNLSIWPRLPSVSGRRRAKTDSGGSKLKHTSSLNNIRETEPRSCQISAPLNARRMCLMETDSN